MKDPYVICRQCSKFKTMNCPNSFFCFATKDKPFFEKKESKKAERKAVYRVVYNKEERIWQIKKDGAKRVITSYPTKEEALKRVKELCESNDMNVIIHKKDGKFQKKKI